jgi:hypothetical protein
MAGDFGMTPAQAKVRCIRSVCATRGLAQNEVVSALALSLLGQGQFPDVGGKIDLSGG